MFRVMLTYSIKYSCYFIVYINGRLLSLDNYRRLQIGELIAGMSVKIGVTSTSRRINN